jgi:competence protein ComEA
VTRLLSTVLALLIGALVMPARAQSTTRPAAAVHHAPADEASPGVVNINDASADELEVLPGIGPARARAIVEHRRAHPFRKIEEITKVKGIGRKTFGRLRPYISVSGPTTLRPEARR